jgi:hypothetical protein
LILHSLALVHPAFITVPRVQGYSYSPMGSTPAKSGKQEATNGVTLHFSPSKGTKYDIKIKGRRHVDFGEHGKKPKPTSMFGVVDLPAVPGDYMSNIYVTVFAIGKDVKRKNDLPPFPFPAACMLQQKDHSKDRDSLKRGDVIEMTEAYFMQVLLLVPPPPSPTATVCSDS